MPVLFAAALAAIISGLMTNVLAPPVARAAVALKALDYPDEERRRHEGVVPRLGGVAIILGMIFGAGSIGMMQWDTWGSSIGRSELVSLAFGTLMVFSVGVIDDLQGVSSLQKFLIELAAALLVVQVGWRFQVVSLPWTGSIDLGLWGWVVSLAWIVGVTNAINLIDGLDGLAGGVVAIIAGSSLVYSVLQGNFLTSVLMGAMVGAAIGFLRHNWAPAKIYMGDSGSLTLGFLLAVMSVHSSIKAPAAVAILVPILALGVPVIDTLLVMLVRFVERPKGQLGGRFLRMFSADRQHLHHLLQNYSARRSRIVGTIYALVFVFCVLALFVALRGSWSLGVTLLVVEVLVILAMRSTGLRAAAQRLASRKRGEIKDDLLAAGVPDSADRDSPPLPPDRSRR